MIWWILLFVVLLLALAPLLQRLAAKAHQEFPYQLNRALFTPAERSFLGVLDQALGTRYRIMGKVRIADLVTVKPMGSHQKWQSAFNKISSKHFDFVLCDSADLSPVAVIELDDKSHSATKQRERDNFVTGVCQAASLVLIRIPARRAYTSSDVERLVVRKLFGTTTSPDGQEMDTTSSQPAAVIQPVPDAGGDDQPDTFGIPLCPQCASTMVLRQVKKGPRAGERLWGCSDYPRCRGIRPYEGKVGQSLSQAS